MSKISLKSLMAEEVGSIDPLMYKTAQGIETPDNTQLEQDFGRLAHMFVQDRAAPLLPYLIGFEVVNQEDDGSKAVGIFGFKIGRSYYYVPAFFLNNQIKGVDMIFSKRTNSFIPLQEDWINNILNRQTIELGGSADPNVRDFERPDFGSILTPPDGSVKYSEDTAWELKEAWTAMADQLADMMQKDAEMQKAWAGFVTAVQKQPIPFEKTAEASPLCAYLSDTGGPDAVRSLLTSLQGNHKFANAALSFYSSVSDFFVNKFAPELLPQKAAEKVTVIYADRSWGDLAQKHKENIVTRGFSIEDRRPPEEKTKVYTTEYADLFSNPEESGEFDVLMTGGRCVRCWVFMPSTAARNGNIVVVNKDIRKYTLAEPGAVFVRDEIKADGDQDDSKDKDTESAYSKAIALSNVNVNKTYVFIDADGNATGPFKIDSMVKIEGKRTRLKVDEVGRYDIVKRPSISNKSSRSWGTINGGDRCCPEHYSDWIRGVELADHKGVATTTDEDVLILPANWKALEVTSTASLGGKQNYTEEEALNNIFKLGTLTDIYASMTKLGMHKLTVANDDGLEFYFRLDDTCATRPHNYKAACISLVKDFGLDLEDADVMLKEAADSFKSKRLIKLAQQRSSLVGVDMPMPTDRAAGADPYTGTPVYGPDEQEMRGQMTNMPNIPDPDEYGINAPRRPQIDPNAQDMAAQAAQIGQKQVFDHAAIGGLSKLYDTGAVIDQYIPDFMKSLDRLGRILFLFYWKNADFAERYGTTDLAEMEDQLRGVFKNFGELVLQLRQRSIAGEDVSTIEA